MPSVIPSPGTLKSALWSFLTANPNLAAIASVHPIHPTTKGELSNGKGRVVMSQITDTLEGTIVTRKILQPIIQCACWGTTEPFTTTLLETLVATLETWTPSTLTMSGQKLESLARLRRVGPVFDAKTSLFVSSIDLRCTISTF